MHATFSGAGKGEKGVRAGKGRERKVLVKDTNREALEGKKKGKEKTDEVCTDPKKLDN